MLRCGNNPVLKAIMFIMVAVISFGLTSNAQAMKITSLGYRAEETGGGAWTGGNLGKTWAEGEWVPYQLLLEDVGPGLAELDSIVISFDFNVLHSGDFLRFVDLVRGIQAGTTRLNNTQGWPKPDGSSFPLTTRDEIEIAQNHPLENIWTGFMLLNLPNDQVNRTLSGGLDVPPGEDRHSFKIYKSDLLAAGIDINEDTVVIYYQLHESRTFIWQNRLQATYDAPPTDVWGGYLYGTDSWDTLSILGSGYVPGAAGHMRLESPGTGQEIPIPVPPWTPGTVSGLKWRDDNGNGVKDEGELPLSGWQIHVFGSVEGVDLSTSTHTDQSGNYSFPNLTSGTWIIKEDQHRDDPVETGYWQTYPTVGIQVGQGTGIAVGPPPTDVAAVGWEVVLTLTVPDQANMNFGNEGCNLTCDVIPDLDSVCIGFDASFTASGNQGTLPYTYAWTGPAGFTANTATINISNAQSDNAGTYQVIVSDAQGCADTCYAELIVLPPMTIIVPQDDSVHAGDYFISTDFSVSNSKKATTVSLCGITPPPAHQPTIVESHVEWQTECADDGKIFTICLEATCDFGCKDTGYFHVTVYNRPPQLTCPDNSIIHAAETFASNDFSVLEPDGDPAPVTFLDINPPATNDPVVVGSHVEWITTVAERGDYFIRLVATDHCGLTDTCEFKVTVDEPTGEFICPDDDSVHAGNLFVSTYFTVTYPECGPSEVAFLDISPSATYDPAVVGDHVEWQTTCAEDGDYVIRLMTTQDCSVQDTCEFTVTVYNRPPELICPDYGIACPNRWFFSTDFFATDPDGDVVQVTILDVDPPDTNTPVIVGNHVEWLVTCEDLGESYIIRLVVTDPCGLADTCEFTVDIYCQPPPDFTLSVDPDTQYVPPGQSAGYLVKLTSLLGFANPCTLFVSGLPYPPDSGIFDQTVLIPTHTTTLNVYTVAETPLGWYVLFITAKEISGPIHHTVQVHLKVEEPSDVEDWADNSNTPQSFALFQNLPNPFNPETKISYHLPKACQVRLTIYNILGQRVKILLDGYQDAGTHNVIWDGRGDDGVALSSGIYFYRLQADSFMETKKMTLMK